jgi:L-ascorbate metabolism protein UlaG (beta-lactamase superfamily)
MVDVIKTLRARVVLPMHAFGDFSLQQFVASLSKDFVTSAATGRRPLRLSLNSLPSRPTVIVLRQTM